MLPQSSSPDRSMPASRCSSGRDCGTVMPAPNWAVVDAGLAVGVDVRVGLEDTLIGRDGGPAPGNAAQVAETAPRMP